MYETVFYESVVAIASRQRHSSSTADTISHSRAVEPQRPLEIGRRAWCLALAGGFSALSPAGLTHWVLPNSSIE